MLHAGGQEIVGGEVQGGQEQVVFQQAAVLDQLVL